ncbi:hypothetical protein [Sphingobacterium tabacisoli]|uniref:Uncharacterized protein n=1 Tax=Sphingobacterium tabacisoli TaxID=2044855 RepID=A0ABW5L118_9SPHI|nr:hypothetical protein [Sphingobacterium tabacisoli]
MSNQYKPIQAWKSFIFYPFATFVIMAVCSFCAYIPRLRTLSGELYNQFLADRIQWALLSSMMLLFFFTSVVFLLIPLFHSRRPLTKITLFFWSFVPYFLYTAIFGYLFYDDQNIDLDKVVPYRSPYSLNKEPFSALEIELTKLHHQGDLSYYLYAISIGFLILALYKGHRKHFLTMVLYIADRPSSYPQETTAAVDNSEDLLHKAEKLANTFSKPPSKAPPKAEIDIEMYAFIYGKGFDYVIINQGFTVPMEFDDKETPENFYDGIFLHINDLLYIRYDHIMLIDVKKKIIIISPLLQKVFDQINKESVKKKLLSYRAIGQPKGYYSIAPHLVLKLKKKFNME